MMKKFFTLLVVSFSVLLMLAFSVLAFSDVSEDDLYYDAVTFLQEQGVVQGYSDGTFGYDRSINRAELLKIAVKAKFLDNDLFLEPFTVLSCFDDVSAGAWYTKYICYAKAAGWVEGYSDGTFRPAQDINFVEALKIMLKIFEMEYITSQPWYRSIVEIAAADNLIPLTIYDFGQIITRAEMADMIVRKIKFDDGQLSEFLGPVKGVLIVSYDTIAAGIHMDEQYDPDSVLPLSINSANAGVRALTLNVSPVVLAEGEQYFAECDKVSGDVGSIRPFVTATMPELTLENLNSGTAYECYAAIKTAEGVLERQSLSLQVTTLADPTQLQFEAAYPGVDDINGFYIFLRVVDDGLADDYQYYFRCMKDGINEGSQPNATTALGYVFLADLEPETNYLCYVAVYTPEGDLNRHSEYRWYRTSPSSFAPELVEILDTASTTTTITINVADVTLAEGEQYFAECDKASGVVGSIRPYATSATTELIVPYLNNNTAYECNVAIKSSDGDVNNRSETVTVTTLVDPAQLQFEAVYAGFDDEDGGVYDYYILLDVVAVELVAEDQYYYRCMKDGVDDRSQPTSTSSSGDGIFMRGLAPGTNYLCYVAVLDSDGFLNRNTEYRWYTTPAEVAL